MIADVRAAVSTVRYALKKQAVEPERALQPEQLDGWCELAEAIAFHQLRAQGYGVRSNQVEELGGAYRHAFLVVQGEGQNQLVDPTFGQFLAKGPGQKLQSSPLGRELLARLLEDGHAAWTVETARVYGECMEISGNPYTAALQSRRPMGYQPLLFQSLLPVE